MSIFEKLAELLKQRGAEFIEGEWVYEDDTRHIYLCRDGEIYQNELYCTSAKGFLTTTADALLVEDDDEIDMVWHYYLTPLGITKQDLSEGMVWYQTITHTYSDKDYKN